MARNNYYVNLIDLKRVTGERKRKGAILTDWQRFWAAGGVVFDHGEKAGEGRVTHAKKFPQFLEVS